MELIEPITKEAPMRALSWTDILESKIQKNAFGIQN